MSEAYVVSITVVGHAKNFYSQIAILFRMCSKFETYLALELSNVKSFLRPWRSLRTGRISEADRYGQAKDYGLSVQTKPKTFQLGNPESCLLRGSCCAVSEAFAADADFAATGIQCRFTSCCDVPEVSSSDGGHLAGGVE